MQRVAGRLEVLQPIPIILLITPVGTDELTVDKVNDSRRSRSRVLITWDDSVQHGIENFNLGFVQVTPRFAGLMTAVEQRCTANRDTCPYKEGPSIQLLLQHK